MNLHAIVLFLLLLGGLVAPVLAVNDQRYSYITVEDITIQLDNGTAIVNVNYSVDEGTRFIFFLLGKQDLKNKLVTILNYDDAQVRRINLSNAEFVIPSAAHSYGSGIYWFPSHHFNVVIPRLSVQTPQITRTFIDTDQFPDGIGFFGDAPVVQ